MDKKNYRQGAAKRPLKKSYKFEHTYALIQKTDKSHLNDNLCFKETLIKYSTHITQSDFSADCTKIPQAYSRMSRSFCTI